MVRFKGNAMKVFFVMMIFALLAYGCYTTGTVPTVFNQPCSIYEDVGATPDNSLIAKLIKNPCTAQKILATAVKIPYIWKQQEYVVMFMKWADKIQDIIKGGVTYDQLQAMVIVQVSKLNKDAGLSLLILSDSIFVFGNEASPIQEMDKKLLLMSLTDLKNKVNQMAIIGGD